MPKIDAKQIAAWKAEFGENNILEIPFADGVSCFIKKPDLSVANLALVKVRSNPYGIAEVILANCWLGGDTAIRNDHHYLLGLQGVADEIFGVVNLEVSDLDGQQKRLVWTDGKQCTLSEPSRQVCGDAIAKARNTPLGMVKYVLQKCWVSGDEDLKNSLGHLYGAMDALNEVTGTKSATVKNC